MTSDTEAPQRPLPAPDACTQFFWDGAKAGELRIQRCNQCEHLIHYPQPVCPRCLSTDLGWTRVSGRATVYTFTEAVQAFHPFFEAQLPYLLAVVELPEQAGLRMMTQLVDCDVADAAIDMAVEVTFLPVSDEITLPLFRPVVG
ncbi:MAG: hypothetical protein JWO68_2485 [Actinomycetia bacterium]|nr:hypothetical protein [Actinomycetes bacterium]